MLLQVLKAVKPAKWPMLKNFRNPVITYLKKFCLCLHSNMAFYCYRFRIREHRFLEIAYSNRVAALHYLQTEVSQVVNHGIEEEALNFQALAAEMFEEQTPVPIYSPQIYDEKLAFIHSLRTQVGSVNFVR